MSLKLTTCLASSLSYSCFQLFCLLQAVPLSGIFGDYQYCIWHTWHLHGSVKRPSNPPPDFSSPNWRGGFPVGMAASEITVFINQMLFVKAGNGYIAVRVLGKYSKYSSQHYEVAFTNENYYISIPCLGKENSWDNSWQTKSLWYIPLRQQACAYFG